MKAKLILLALLFISTGVTAQNIYYYYQGKRIDLVIDWNYLNIVMNDGVERSSVEKLLNRNFDIESDGNQRHPNKKLKVKFKNTQSSSSYWETINTLKQNSDIKLITPCFQREGSVPISISNVFYVKLKEIKDTVLLKEIAEQQSVQIVKQVPYMPNWYILSLSNLHKTNMLEIPNLFYETGHFEEIDPAFMFNFKSSCTDDPEFSLLWGLKNNSYSGIDIDACNAWTITRGAGVNVAVVEDGGIDVSHADLAGNIHPLSFNMGGGQSECIGFILSNCDHGTSVSGVIAAVKDNNLQIVGVAPESKIMAVGHYQSAPSVYSAEMASGISWAWENGADVINNSWGDYGGSPSLYDQYHSSILEDAIIDAMTQGRDGKGCVVLFAAGNTGLPNRVDYPGNFHDDILTVGSINSNGNRSNFSNYGEKLDVVAPGGSVWLLWANNQTKESSGTSFATPHVAGVAALVLSANPNLTGQQVRDIIESTAKKVHQNNPYIYQTINGRPNGTWNDQMGYGLVNAYEAVQKAIEYAKPSIPQNIQCTSISSTEIKVEWDNVPNATEYILECSSTPRFTPLTITTYALPYDLTSKNITGLTPGRTYYFRVKSRNSTGDSGYSIITNCTTPCFSVGNGTVYNPYQITTANQLDCINDYTNGNTEVYFQIANGVSITRLLGNLTLQSKAVLTVMGTLTMPSTAQIIVQNGGKLIVNGGTVKNADITVKTGSHLTLENNGVLEKSPTGELVIDVGATFDFLSGEIKN